MAMQAPHIRVTLSDRESPFIVRVLNPDMVAWDRIRAARRWPTMEEASSLWSTYVSWHAANRAGQIPKEMKYEHFEAACELLEAVDADGNELTEGDTNAGTVDPTPPEVDRSSYVR